MRIRTRRGVLRRYNTIVRRLYRDTRVSSWDMYTVAICYPVIALKLHILARLYKLLPN